MISSPFVGYLSLKEKRENMLNNAIKNNFNLPVSFNNKYIVGSYISKLTNIVTEDYIKQCYTDFRDLKQPSTNTTSKLQAEFNSFINNEENLKVLKEKISSDFYYNLLSNNFEQKLLQFVDQQLKEQFDEFVTDLSNALLTAQKMYNEKTIDLETDLDLKSNIISGLVVYSGLITIVAILLYFY